MATTMNRKLRDAWVIELRSGNYDQCQGCLYNEETDSYCALGVLIETEGTRYWEITPHDTWGIRINDFISALGVPADLIPTTDAVHIARMNDKGKNFDEIADYIEEYL